MNASLNSRPVSFINACNEWRKSVTTAAIAAIIAGVDAAKAALPFKSFPWNDTDCDINEKAFSLRSLTHTLEWLRSDTRDLDKLRQRMAWMEEAPGKLAWMERKFKAEFSEDAYKATLTKAALAGKNDLQAAMFAKKAYKGFDANVIASLDAKVNAAKDAAKYSIYLARTALDEESSEFQAKIEGFHKAIENAGSLEQLDKDGATLSAKRKLAVEIEAIIAGRQTELDAAKAARAALAAEQAQVNAEIDAEIEAAIASSPVRKSRTTVKAPAVARNEIKADLTTLADALVQKDSRSWVERKITLKEAIEIAGNKDLLKQATDNALECGEEEALPATASRQAALLVRKSGAVKRFFVKEPAAA